MSGITGSEARSLVEAYASIYNSNDENETRSNFFIEELDLSSRDIFEDIKDYLVCEGFAKTEKEASAMIPHMGEGWVNQVVSHIVISEQFLHCINSLLEQGYDLSSHSLDELYEEYNGRLNTVLNEAYADTAGIDPVTQAAAMGIGGALLAGKKLYQGAKYVSDIQKRNAEQQLKKAGQLFASEKKPRVSVGGTRPQGTTTSVPSSSMSGTGSTPGGGGGDDGNKGGGDKKPGIWSKIASDLSKGFKKQVGFDPAKKLAPQLGSAITQSVGRGIGTGAQIAGKMVTKPLGWASKLPSRIYNTPGAISKVAQSAWKSAPGKNILSKIAVGSGLLGTGVGIGHEPTRRAVTGAASGAGAEAQKIQRGVSAGISAYQGNRSQQQRPQTGKPTPIR